MSRLSISLLAILGVWLSLEYLPCTTAQYRIPWYKRLSPSRLEHEDTDGMVEGPSKSASSEESVTYIQSPQHGGSLTGRRQHPPPNRIDMTPGGRRGQGRSWKIQGRSCGQFVSIRYKIEKDELDSAINQYEAAPICRRVIDHIQFIKYVYNALKNKDNLCNFLKRRLIVRPDKRANVQLMHKELQRRIQLAKSNQLCAIQF